VTLLLPPSIDAANTRALVGLLSRWDELGVDRVLVWHVDSVEEGALPHLADTVGVLGVRYIDGPPREFVKRAIALVRTRGTPGCLRQVLASLGYDTVTVQEQDTVHRYDGTIRYDGVWTHGLDAHWSVFWVFVEPPLPAEVDLATYGSVAFRVDTLSTMGEPVGFTLGAASGTHTPSSLAAWLEEIINLGAGSLELALSVNVAHHDGRFHFDGSQDWQLSFVDGIDAAAGARMAALLGFEGPSLLATSFSSTTEPGPPEPPDAAVAREVWDGCAWASPERSRFVLILDNGWGRSTVYREVP
jgi:hypothetical protein